MMPQMQRWLMGWLIALVTLTALPAQAGDNDVVLSNFGQCETSSESDCTGVAKETDNFENLSTELAQVFAPRFVNASDTLGEAGFAVNLMMSGSVIPNQEEHWQEGLEGAPGSTLYTAHLQMRKGLPFSFELGGDLGYLLNSEMFNMGAHLQWALHEGYHYFPDIAVRGTVNNLMGSSELNLLTAGWDISASKEIEIAGVSTLTPYVGYQQLHVIASSRVLNAHPQDPRPPQYDDEDGNRNFAPEFVFDQFHEPVNRFFVGTEFDVWILNFALEGVLAEDVTQVTLGGGVDF